MQTSFTARVVKKLDALMTRSADGYVARLDKICRDVSKEVYNSELHPEVEFLLWRAFNLRNDSLEKIKLDRITKTAITAAVALTNGWIYYNTTVVDDKKIYTPVYVDRAIWEKRYSTWLENYRP